MRAERKTTAWLISAAILFALVYLLRNANADSASDGVAGLYSLPVALIALRFGLRGGLLAAGLGTALIFADTNGELTLSALGYTTRITVLITVGGLVGWFTDSERQLHGERDREQEKVRRFFALSHDMLCTADRDGYFVDVNPAWERTLGYTPEAIRAQPFLELVHPDDRERTADQAAAIFEGDATVDFSNRYLAEDGSIHWLRWSAICGEDGMIYARATDVTSQVRSDAALRAAADELERSNHDLKQFAYIASHDLNEPLRTIAGFAQLLGRRYEDQVDDRGRDYIRRMVGGVERMQTLINDLLRFSRAGQEKRELEPVDSAELVSQVIADLENVIARRGAQVEVKPLPTVSGDRNQLQQVFQNLISNAIKFANGGTPRVVVAAKPTGPGWQFSVADNGIGIEPDQRERVFGAFERLHAREDYEGTGIGLAICKKIVERHGGAIHVEDGIDGGSRFVFTVAEESQSIA